jgi:hypothetical protein
MLQVGKYWNFPTCNILRIEFEYSIVNSAVNYAKPLLGAKLGSELLLRDDTVFLLSS